MHRLRNKLILAFVAATLPPLVLTFFLSRSLLEQSLDLAPLQELDELSQTLQRTGRELYQRSCDVLKNEAAAGRVTPERFLATTRDSWPSSVEEFAESSDAERFSASGNRLEYYRRDGDGVLVYSKLMDGGGMQRLAESYKQARGVVEASRSRDLRRGFTYTLALIAIVMWTGALALLVYWAHRISRPIQQLTRALGAVAGGDLSARVEAAGGSDEIGAAIAAFHHMAAQLKQSRDRLVLVTRLSSWQALARKMAHEVKNSLTPIRLTMEEIAARRPSGDNFLEQASQIVVEEVVSLEKRVRAFSEFAAEPPVSLVTMDVNAVALERIALLRGGHPDLRYDTRLESGMAVGDPDLVKGVLTNLLENAAAAAGPGGIVLLQTRNAGGSVEIEVHDSGPGLSPQARLTLFEPSISFKKGGMGLGLSIAHKSALLCGGELAPIDSLLPGAAFRLTLPMAPAASENKSLHVQEAHPHR